MDKITTNGIGTTNQNQVAAVKDTSSMQSSYKYLAVPFSAQVIQDHRKYPLPWYLRSKKQKDKT